MEPSPAISPDPRVYFAAERTLLAWIRTGIAVIGVGFLVARFGLFLRMVRQEQIQTAYSMSAALGVTFILLGAVGMAGAAWQFHRFLRSLGASDRPPGYWMPMAFWYAAVLSLLAHALAVYLVWGSAGSTPP